MLTATKEFVFDAAHMLTDHEGLCKNLHGHTYRVEVSVFSNCSSEVISTGPSMGMVIDFKDLKNLLNENLFDKLDHAYVYHEKGEATETRIARVLDNAGLKIYQMANRPTAENMAKHFAEEIEKLITWSGLPVRLKKIRVYETPTSYAEVVCS